eukprot:TRINITY_DN7369_c0_g1_i1.p1 TRINITY_DN7369_c0_g1~~TRINITY_DN7369_c0_g1_i1.p1  ORF type:complete len:619 (-),score=154.35 TRINITY_DN7369_c0_g1_i1:179-2035(-)
MDEESYCIDQSNDLVHLCQESDDGNVEYKWKLVNPTPERFEHLVTQLQFRLNEGQGEAFYEIGVDDSGYPKGLNDMELSQSLETLQRMTNEIGAEICAQVERKGEKGKVVQLLVRQFMNADEGSSLSTASPKINVRVAVCGNVDAGKSTLISVLTRGGNDNGRGSSRIQIFQHKHEIETGRTSSINIQTLGYDVKGKVVNYNVNSTNNDHDHLSPDELMRRSCKLVSFIDLAGHEKYLKTTVTGLSGQQPDYVMLLVGANMGVTRMTKEHLGIALSLKLPVIVVITKIDICPPNVLENTLQSVVKLLKLPGVRKMSVVVKNMNDVMTCIRSSASPSSAPNDGSDRICPIFLVSNVTGKNMDLLRGYLNLAPPKREWKAKNEPAEFVIDGDFYVTGVGTVVSGTVLSGTINTNSTLLLGPDSFGNFTPVQIKSIHSKRVPLKTLTAGQAGTFALKKIKRTAIRPGMVLVDAGMKPKAYREFTVDLLVLFHSTTIKVGYQPVIHCHTVRQTSTIVSIIGKEVLRTGDRATVGLRFMFAPEYLKVGSRVLFREGRTKCVGTITALSLPTVTPALPLPIPTIPFTEYTSAMTSPRSVITVANEEEETKTNKNLPTNHPPIRA